MLEKVAELLSAATLEPVEAACCSDEVPEIVDPWVEYVGAVDVLECLEKVDEWAL